MSAKRYTQREFPAYAFVPGLFPHPEKSGGHMFNKDLNIDTYDKNAPLKCEAFLFALDLFNYGYYWESHVYLEELWNQCQRKGEDADLFKVLIKLGAAGVKKKLFHQEAAIGHLNRAIELLETQFQSHTIAAIDLQKLKNKILKWKEDQLESQIQIEIN